jgi:hypothetical protein
LIYFLEIRFVTEHPETITIRAPAIEVASCRPGSIRMLEEYYSRNVTRTSRLYTLTEMSQYIAKLFGLAA